ncbi:MAG: PD-(D/E)XK nuclease family protein [Dehalococcoidia bacterium]|nr:PD-(D/E)XK nuclease family protein [Dehalococcoidia bacterium]
MQRKYSFTPILGWSVSRYDKFETCKRWYWYDYYAKKYDREVSPQKLDSLRSLTSTPLEIGNLVHDAIATQLHRIRKNTPPQNTAEVLAYSSYLVDRAILSKTFLEVYYKQRDQIDAADLKSKVKACLENFFQSPRYQWLLQDDHPHRSDWIIEPNDFGEVRLNNLKAYCKVDFLFPTADGKLNILDWKTGKIDRDKHLRQMTGYVLYARDILNAKPDRVNPVIVYLGESYEELNHSFNESDLDEFAAQVSRETQEMYAYCKDIAQNIPKPKDSFPKHVKRLCAYCNYQELCQV